MSNKDKKFQSTNELYRGVKLIPLNIDAVEDRIEVLSAFLEEELSKDIMSQNMSEINRLDRAISFWRQMRDEQTM